MVMVKVMGEAHAERFAEPVVDQDALVDEHRAQAQARQQQRRQQQVVLVVRLRASDKT